MAFTFPFCYTPRPEIVAAARRLSARIESAPALQGLFAEGKMLGVLMVETRWPVEPAMTTKGCTNRCTPFVIPSEAKESYFLHSMAARSTGKAAL
jgi:hypothetical protein